MHESITMAEVGSIVKVSGRRMATPLGPPRPGSTPTKMPRIKPTIISASVFHVSSTLKPYIRRPNASIPLTLVTEQGFERPLRHDDVERDLESDEHDEREEERREQRLPGRDAADGHHEARDQQEARHVQTEPLRKQAKEQGREEYLQHAAQLVAGDEGFARVLAREELPGEAPEAGAGEDHRQIEREVAGLRAGRIPPHAGAPVVEREQPREREQRERDDDVDRAIAGHRRRIARRRGRVLDDDFVFGFRGHQLATKPASVIRLLLSASSSSRNLSMSRPVRKTGFKACFSM